MVAVVADQRSWTKARSSALGGRFENLPAGQYRLLRLDHPIGGKGVALPRNSMLIDIEGSGMHEVVLVAPGAGVVCGVLQVPGARADDAAEAVLRSPHWVRAQNGHFRFDELGAGTYEVRVRVDRGPASNAASGAAGRFKMPQISESHH